MNPLLDAENVNRQQSNTNFRQMAIDNLVAKGIAPERITGDMLQIAIDQLAGQGGTSDVDLDTVINGTMQGGRGAMPTTVQELPPPQTRTAPVTAANSQQQNAPPPAPMQKPQMQSPREEAAEGAASNPAEEAAEVPMMSAGQAAQFGAMPAGGVNPASITMANQPEQSDGVGTQLGVAGGAGALLAAMMAGSNPRVRAALRSKLTVPSAGVATTPQSAFGAGGTALRSGGGATSKPTPAPMQGPPAPPAAPAMAAGDLGLNAAGAPADAELARLVREFSQGKPAMDGPLLREIKRQEGLKAKKPAASGKAEVRRVGSKYEG